MSQKRLAESLGITPRSLQRALNRHEADLLAEALGRRLRISDRRIQKITFRELVEKQHAKFLKKGDKKSC